MKRIYMLIAGAAALLLGFALTAPVAVAAAPSKTVDPSLYAGLKWRNVGPQLGGRSIAVAGSAARPKEYFFGATGGGLWKTTDGGTEWAPVTDGQISSSSVGAVEVCPKNPDVVYIGMGEVDLRGSVIPGDGVYKSTDAGKTWKHLGLADTQMIGRIQVDPNNCDHVYVAAQGHVWGPNTQRGVFRTTDGGANWQRVLFVDDQTGAVDLALDPADPNVVYAGMWQVQGKFWQQVDGGPGSGLYKSTDGGTTWTPLTSRLGLPAGAPIGKVGVGVSPVHPNRVYALVEANAGGLFRSDDAGATWKLVNNSQDIRQRAFYYSRVIADPVDADRVYVPNVSFLRSNDGGATFSTINSVPHGDNHALWIDPNDNNRMIEGNDGGATVSTNGGASWTAEDYPTGQFYTVVTTGDDPYLICGEQQDRGTTCVSSTGGTGQLAIPGGSESGPIAVDPRDSNVFYVGDCCGPWTGSMSRFDRSGKSAVGARRIDPWPDNPMGSAAGKLKYRFQWSYPLVTNPAEPNAVFAGSQHVMKSTNGGQSWQEISPDLSYADPSTLGDSGGPITLDQTGIEYYTTHAADAENDLAVLHDPDNAVRSVSGNVTVGFTLKQDVTSASMQFLAADGTVVATNTLPTKAGTGTTTWNLRYPDAVGFPGLIYWSANNQGPKAPTGGYTARLVVNGKPLQQSFDVLKDSRLTNVTDADIAAQFQLDLAVRDATNDANQDVIDIRACTAQVDDRVAKAGDPAVTQAGTSLNGELNAVQDALYQTKLQASEDPLNFGIKLDNRIASLHGVIESVDGRPTDQTAQVFDGLNTQLQTQLQKLRTAVGTDVPAFNQLTAQHGQAPITCSAV